MEVAEVQAAFPQMECIVFPKDDPRAVWTLLYRLRETFGKRSVSEEDGLRLSSIRTAAAVAEEQVASADVDGFLRNAEAEITIDTRVAAHERTLELINKTNQFNLNGKRVTPAAWTGAVQRDGAFVAAVSYKDRFGPLGVIAVLAGTEDTGKACLEHWVMSCRAFSRRIEHRCLEWLFGHFGVDEIEMQFVPTERNVPLQEFLRTVTSDMPRDGNVLLRRQTFETRCPPLFHKVREL
jgi:FkbH-like protein